MVEEYWGGSQREGNERGWERGGDREREREEGRAIEVGGGGGWGEQRERERLSDSRALMEAKTGGDLRRPNFLLIDAHFTTESNT